MPVNMDPKKRRRTDKEPEGQSQGDAQSGDLENVHDEAFGKETEEDREKDLADAEVTNLWDATEVIDMDKW